MTTNEREEVMDTAAKHYYLQLLLTTYTNVEYELEAMAEELTEETLETRFPEYYRLNTELNLLMAEVKKVRRSLGIKRKQLPDFITK